MPFRPKPEYELRVADVCWLSPARAKQALVDDDVFGSPEFVVEVLYPSKTHEEACEKRDLCFASGCDEFWIIDGDLSFIEVAFATGTFSVRTNDELVEIGGALHETGSILDTHTLLGGPRKTS